MGSEMCIRDRYTTVAHTVSFVCGGCITAVDIPLRLIRPSRRGFIYGRHYLVPAVATSPFNTDLCFRFIPTRRPPTRLLVTPFGGGEVAVCGRIWSAADTSTIVEALQQQNINGVNCVVPTRGGFAHKLRGGALRS